MALKPQADPPRTVPTEVIARASVASVASFGGNPTGRKLAKFKHPAESPEGIEERRLADAERKKLAREAEAKKVEPPPLPSAGANGAGVVSPPGGGVGVDANGAPLTPGDPPPAPWQPELLSDLVAELLAAAEQGRVAQFVGRCEEAKLLPKLIKETESDAHFPKPAIVLLKRSLPRLAAKWLNKAGVSSEYQDELACVTAVLLIVQHDRKFSEKVDELIAAHRPKEKPKANELAA